MRFFSDIKTRKVNVIGDNFWFQPSIWTMSRRKYAARPYKSLHKLIKVENFLEQNFVFHFNSDEKFDLFRKCQEYKKMSFFLNQEQWNIIKEKGHFDVKLKGSKITQRWDKKGVKMLKYGYCPFFSIKWLNSFFKNQDVIIIWRKKGFIDI